MVYGIPVGDLTKQRIILTRRKVTILLNYRSKILTEL